MLWVLIRSASPRHMLWYSLEVPHRGASNEYHNICFYGELEKIIPELSSNTPPYQDSLFSINIGRDTLTEEQLCPNCFCLPSEKGLTLK